MKKFILLSTLIIVLGAFQARAQQGGGDAAQREAMIKEMKAQLVEKAKITEEQADKVLEINRGNRDKMRGMKELSEEERTKKLEEINTENTKKYKEIPLTEDQIKAINEYFAERRKNMQKKGGTGQGG